MNQIFGMIKKQPKKIIDESNWLKGKVEQFEEMTEQCDDAEVLYELGKEENDEELIDRIYRSRLDSLKNK